MGTTMAAQVRGGRRQIRLGKQALANRPRSIDGPQVKRGCRLECDSPVDPGQRMPAGSTRLGPAGALTNKPSTSTGRRRHCQQLVGALGKSKVQISERRDEIQASFHAAPTGHLSFPL